MIVRASMRSPPQCDAALVAGRHGAAEPHFDAELFEAALRRRREGRIEGRKHARSGFDQDDPRLRRIDGAEIPGQRLLGELGDRAGHLDAGRARADDDEVEQPTALFLVRFALRLLEGEKDAPPNVSRIVDALQPRGVFAPFVVAEIGVLRAGRDDELVEGDAPSLGDDLLAADVDAGDFGEHHRRIGLPAEDLADRRGDVGGRETGRRNLIEKRLEQMVVVAVDHDEVDRRLPKRFRRGEAGEARSDDDDARARTPKT